MAEGRGQKSEVGGRGSEVRGQMAEDRGQGAEARSQRADTEVVSAELLTVKVCYKAPDAAAGRSAEFALVDRGAAFADASSDFRFAAAVAGFGMVLRGSPYVAETRFSDILEWARPATGVVPDRRRIEFVSLVRRAGEIVPVSS